MTTNEIAKRLSAIERELARLKIHGTNAGKSHPIRMLERIHGTFENDDAFQEAMRLGRKWRKSDRPTRQSKAKSQVIYILDTDVFTLCELPDSPEYLRLHSHVLELEEEDRLVTTIVTYEEQTRGWLAYAAKSRETRHQIKAYDRLKRHLLTYLSFEVLDFDSAAAKEFDRLRRLKLAVGTADLKIAAIALSNNGMLLSRNLKDFQKVPELNVADWTSI